MPTAFRLVRAEHSADAFSGEGARIWGGRWSSPGRSVVYAADSLALAALETLVHILPRRDLVFVSFRIEIPAELITTPSNLPPGWDDLPPPPEAAIVGDTWLESHQSAVLRVPSAVVRSAENFLLDPRHPDFDQITIDSPGPFAFDRRLLDS